MLFNRDIKTKLPELPASRPVDIHHATARVNDDQRKAAIQKYTDAKRHTMPSSLAVGDPVLLQQQKQLSNKMAPFYDPSPYRITQKTGSMVLLFGGDPFLESWQENAQRHVNPTVPVVATTPPRLVPPPTAPVSAPNIDPVQALPFGRRLETIPEEADEFGEEDGNYSAETTDDDETGAAPAEQGPQHLQPKTKHNCNKPDRLTYDGGPKE